LFCYLLEFPLCGPFCATGRLCTEEAYMKEGNDLGGEVLGVGTYGDPAETQRIFFRRLRRVDSAVASTALRNKGYTVLSVH
jgi:hypothetical protein